MAAEDTRHFATLARHHGIGTRAVSYHDHNEEARTRELLARLRAGEDVALVSDAGTPLVSDPGYRLVRAAIDAGIAVTSLPGPSAVTTALAASGLPPHPFRFLGFLPRTRPRLAGPRSRRSPATRPRSSPSRLRDAWPPRSATRSPRSATARACLARNLTKPHERYQRGLAGRRSSPSSRRRARCVASARWSSAARSAPPGDRDRRGRRARCSCARRAGACDPGTASSQRHGLVEARGLRPRPRAAGSVTAEIVERVRRSSRYRDVDPDLLERLARRRSCRELGTSTTRSSA